MPKCGGTTTRYLLEAAATIRGDTVFNEAGAFSRDEVKPGDEATARIVLSHSPPKRRFDDEDTAYFTVLRDPVSRGTSLLQHVTARNSGARWNPEKILEGLGPAAFNHATHLIGWQAGDDDLERSLARAKRRMESDLAFFGLQERFSEFASLLAGFVGLEGFIYPRFQVAEVECDITDVMLERLHERSWLDRELYRFAETLYEERYSGIFEDDRYLKLHPERSYVSLEYDGQNDVVEQSLVKFR
ncbi:MAG: hypothetical protein RH950_14050 [Nisaea sp.]